MKKSTLLNGLKYLLGLSLLAYVVWSNWAPRGRAGLGSVWQKHVVEGQPINSLALGLACLFCLCSVLLTFLRWYLLVRAQDLPFTVPNAMRLGMIGYFLNAFLPGAVGGDIVKAAFIAREQSRRTVAVGTVLVDRAIGLWALFWLVALVGVACWAGGFLAGEVQNTLHAIVLGALGLVGATSAAWLVLGMLPASRAERFAGRLERIPKAGHAFAELWRAVWMYRLQGRIIALALGMSVIGHVGFVLTFYFAALTLNPADQIPSLATHFLIIPIGMAAQAGFPTPGGLGGAELIFGKLYQLVHQPEGNGLLMALVYRVVTWGLGLVGYLVYLKMRPALARQTAGTGPVPEPALEGFEPDGARVLSSS